MFSDNEDFVEIENDFDSLNNSTNSSFDVNAHALAANKDTVINLSRQNSNLVEENSKLKKQLEEQERKAKSLQTRVPPPKTALSAAYAVFDKVANGGMNVDDGLKMGHMLLSATQIDNQHQYHMAELKAAEKQVFEIKNGQNSLRVTGKAVGQITYQAANQAARALASPPVSGKKSALTGRVIQNDIKED